MTVIPTRAPPQTPQSPNRLHKPPHHPPNTPNTPHHPPITPHLCKPPKPPSPLLHTHTRPPTPPQDYTRTGTYYSAIVGNPADFAGRVVMDVGAGSGILSLFAAQVCVVGVCVCVWGWGGVGWGGVGWGGVGWGALWRVAMCQEESGKGR